VKPLGRPKRETADEIGRLEDALDEIEEGLEEDEPGEDRLRKGLQSLRSAAENVNLGYTATQALLRLSNAVFAVL
jgi:hypothetical protein